MSAPTYQLFDGDCLEVMATLEAQSVDAIIVDPPYGTTACSWDVVIPFAPMWKQIKRIIKPRGAVVMFGSEPFSSLLRVSNLEWYKYDWVWDKIKPSGFLNAKHQPMIRQECISVFGNRSTVYNPIMSNRKSKKLSRAYTRSDTNGYIELDTEMRIYNMLYPQSIICYSNADQTNAIHPTQKPVSLLEYLVKTYTNPGDTVLDFTMGSCPTGKASIKLGRNFIGIDNGKCEKENSEYYGWSWVEYARVALANIAGEFTLTPQEKAAGQMALFTPAYA